MSRRSQKGDILKVQESNVSLPVILVDWSGRSYDARTHHAFVALRQAGYITYWRI